MKLIIMFLVLFLSHMSFAESVSDSAHREEEKQFDQFIKALDQKNKPDKKNCIDYPEQTASAPITDEYPKVKSRDFARCSSRDEGYQYCFWTDSQKPHSFEFQNTGSSALIPEKNAARGRTWKFNFPYQARQDMYISVRDEPNHNNSQLRDSYMYLFPRKNTPSIRRDGDRFIVTLPTGEEAYFDAKTKDVLSGGVLKETGPLAKPSKELDPPKVSYTGTGVMVRVNARGADPRLGGGKAQITKQGKICEVAKSDLWPDQTSDSALHFKYSRDQDFNSYLKKKCGFGLD